MGKGDGRYKAITPVTDYSISQRIRVALIEDGRTDLAVESITQPIRDLEEKVALQDERIVALEQEKRNWQTESGVHRIIDEKMGAAAVDWGSWALRAVLGSVATALFATLCRLAWIGLKK